MEYTVGSLADLITGSNTPNKPKVVTKKIKRTLNVTLGDNKELDEPIVSNENKAKKIKKNLSDSPIKQSRKRSSDVDNKESSPTKKSKNEKNAEKRVNKKIKEQNKVEEPRENKEKTIFVNNIPIVAKIKDIKNVFSKYGNVESVRIRGVATADPKVPKKVAFIKKEFHPQRKTFHAYVKFSTKDEALKALEANGALFMDHHLIVDKCDDSKDHHNESKAIFVGNLSFNAEVEDLWKIFEPCGSIQSIRIVRDPRTGMGKGFAYVNFQNSDSVQLALSMENVQLNNRELRISFCNIKAAHKNKKSDVGKKIKQAGKPKKKPLKEKIKENEENPTNEEKKTIITDAQFQGSKYLEKKKKKKDLKEKKKMIKLVAPRTKD